MCIKALRRGLFKVHALHVCVSRRNLERFEMAHNSAMNAVDPDSGNGEVTIRLPTDCFQIIAGTRETFARYWPMHLVTIQLS